jgi:cell wall assembly regulator SMI1
MTDRSVAESWLRIDAWLARQAPDTSAALPPPVTEDALATLEDEFGPFGLAVPADVIASLRIHDGSGSGRAAFSVLRRYRLVGAHRMRAAIRNLRELDDEMKFSGDVVGLDRWWSRAWLVVAEPVWDGALIVDAGPGERSGQVRTWEAEPIGRTVVATSFADLLAAEADRLEDGASQDANEDDA